MNEKKNTHTHTYLQSVEIFQKQKHNGDDDDDKRCEMVLYNVVDSYKEKRRELTKWVKLKGKKRKMNSMSMSICVIRKRNTCQANLTWIDREPPHSNITYAHTKRKGSWIEPKTWLQSVKMNENKKKATATAPPPPPTTKSNNDNDF